MTGRQKVLLRFHLIKIHFFLRVRYYFSFAVPCKFIPFVINESVYDSSSCSTSTSYCFTKLPF